MATVVTITCDHCGNRINKPNKFTFGPKTVYDDDEDEDDRPAKRGKFQPTPPKPKQHEREEVDLCNVCMDIWMERVRKITKASDPDVSN